MLLPGAEQQEGSLDEVYNEGYDIAAEIYLNDDGQIILEKYDFTGRVKDDEDGVSSIISSKFNTKYYDIGTDVKIEAPEVQQ